MCKSCNTEIKQILEIREYFIKFFMIHDNLITNFDVLYYKRKSSSTRYIIGFFYY